MRTTTVSCRGDKAYIRALKHIAEKKGVHIGDIVRQAIDSVFSDDIIAADKQLSLILPRVSHESDKRHEELSVVA